MVATLLALVAGLVFGQPQLPGLPVQFTNNPQQQVSMIRESRVITNVAVVLTTTIREVEGVRIDSQFLPLRTNLMFKLTTNLYEVDVPMRP